MLHYVVSDYMATGEGHSLCILITMAYPQHDDYERADSKSHMQSDGTFHFEMPNLKAGVTPNVIALRQFKEEFGDFHVRGAQIMSEQDFLLRHSTQVPSYILSVIDNQRWPDKAAGNVYYASIVHLNYS
jgi:hypothetical protein